MGKFITGWFRLKPINKKKRQPFMSMVYCGECRRISSVSRLGQPCPKCGAGPDYVSRASHWDFDAPKVRGGLHLGKVKVDAC